DRLTTQLANDIKISKARLETASKIIDEISSVFVAIPQLPEQQEQDDRFQKELEKLENRIRLVSNELEDLITSSIINSPKEAKLFLNKTIEPIPTGAPLISSLESQLRRDLWFNRDGIAVFSKIAKSNPQNY
ncbi:hypothetical protein AAHH59_10770, partial [Pediococcus acidilactici]|uniref:hypothetical protein n=1 Tax=Pediococcus acidilactici TaxID=1254 RepID=UPI003197F89D